MAKEEHCCGGHFSSPSVHQSMIEMEFERGIWSAALNGEDTEVLNHLDRGTSPDATDNSGYSALHYASRNGHLKVCRLLLQRGANPNLVTRSGRVTSLQRAAYKGHEDVVKILLQYKADPAIQDTDGMSALHKAVEGGHAGVVKLLVTSAPGCVNIPNNKGRLPKDCVSSANHTLLSLLGVKELDPD